jgi:hypothetical protein
MKTRVKAPVYYVLAVRGLQTKLIGPYRKFKYAEGSAQYWDKRNGWSVSVVPVTPIKDAQPQLEPTVES